ncbi:MAG: DUF1192 domain-containing protein [Brevundimonas sp.]|uniref:DUF1192 domain-containing protein n=1 Tax=Brevundimonas sp. TaxID=1871086 RepID=UPI0027331674|nr:DUF1192 domain-containing protein [Brevundimonas sp.]MDP3405355.1 DUF1192 domain-containing protein [Brevundimonas sp.]
MTFDDLDPRPQRGAALTALAREDLDLYAVEELGERIEALETEITRVRTALAAKAAKKSAADALFNFRP